MTSDVPSPGDPIDREVLEAAACWEADDNVPRRPAMTAFRRAARLRQASWRDAQGLPVGSQPIVPQPGAAARPVGSRLEFDRARNTAANFVTPAARAAVRERMATVEPHQSIDHRRLWADLLSSQALAFNLFGDLWAELDAADRAVHQWFPDAPGRVSAVRFVHSPGRFDPEYLNSLRDVSAAFVLDAPDGSRGIVAVAVTYHERSKAEIPKPENRDRYTEVAERSGVFGAGAIEALLARSDLCVMWLEHLLVSSMLQHPRHGWTWARYLVVHPASNPDVVDMCSRYRALLTDETTFATMTLGGLLDSGVLAPDAVSVVRERYLP